MKRFTYFFFSKKIHLLVAFVAALLVLGLSYLDITSRSEGIQASALNQISFFQLVLPIVKTSDQISVYTVTNSSIFTASTSHNFYNGGYPSGTFVTNFLDTQAVSATKTYTLDTINIPYGFVGDVVILSDQPITGSATILRPAITVTMKADRDTAEIGQTITYTYEVTNTSIFTFNLISGIDNKLGNIPFNTTTLEPQHYTTSTLIYTVTPGDFPGPLTNIVTASGTVSGGTVVTATATNTITIQKGNFTNYLPIILKN
ncbi:MAG: hypothetical protein GY797_34780 [Deltaproteobacteria bacterium]|nr:hypothetical protein [Deltaproteobacteria bacterium]